MDSIRYEFMDDIYNQTSNLSTIKDNRDILKDTKSLLKSRKILLSGLVILAFYLGVLLGVYSGIISHNDNELFSISSLNVFGLLGVALAMIHFLLLSSRMKDQKKLIKYFIPFAELALSIYIIDYLSSQISLKQGFLEDQKKNINTLTIFLRFLFNFHIFLSQFILPFCLDFSFLFTFIVLIFNTVLLFYDIPWCNNFTNAFKLDIFLFLQKYMFQHASMMANRNDRTMKYIGNLINKMFCQFFAFNKGKIVFTNQSAKSFLKSKFHMMENHPEEVKPIKFFTTVKFIYMNSSIDQIIWNENEVNNNIQRKSPSLMKIISQFESSELENHMFYFIGIIEYLDPISNEKYYFNVFIRKNEIEQSSWIEVMMYDITLAKRIEIIDETIKLKEKLLSKIAHEFKTPLICIISLAEELEAAFNKSSTGNVIVPAKKKIKQVNDLSNYTLYLINDIAHFLNNNTKNLGYVLHNIHTQMFYGNKSSKEENVSTKSITSSQRIANGSQFETKELELKLEENVPVNDILQFAFRILRTLLIYNKNKIKFITPVKNFTQSNDVFIKTDPLRLKQILLNLISNAVKFTQGGRIELNSSLEENHHELKYLVLSVKDTGIGIKSEDLDKIFKDYKMLEGHLSLNYMGTGLGLSISDHLAKLLGYKMKVTSEEGIGSCFSIVIPLPLPAIIKKKKITLHKMPSSPNLSKILLKKEEYKNFRAPVQKKTKSKQEVDSDIINLIKISSKFKQIERTKHGSDMSIQINNIISSNNVSNINAIQIQDPLLNYDTTRQFPFCNYTNTSRDKYREEDSSVNSGDTVKKEFTGFNINLIRKLQGIHFSEFNDNEDEDEDEDEEELNKSQMILNSISLKKFLIVDDNALILSTLENQIKSLIKKNQNSSTERTQFEIVKGYDGVDLLKEIIEDQKYNRIQCIFTDENMEFINGSEAIRILLGLILKKKVRPVPIVVLSASGLKEFAFSQQSAPTVIYLGKPFKEEDIGQILFQFGILTN